MAQRVGKYKLTKREQETSLTDGGTINGSVNVTGDATVATVVASTEGELRQVTPAELMS